MCNANTPIGVGSLHKRGSSEWRSGRCADLLLLEHCLKRFFTLLPFLLSPLRLPYYGAMTLRSLLLCCPVKATFPKLITNLFSFAKIDPTYVFHNSLCSLISDSFTKILSYANQSRKCDHNNWLEVIKEEIQSCPPLCDHACIILCDVFVTKT